ncbi:aldolase/citrate lyase family protein [Undibacterium sp. TS12]|uniref:HpcH/HpaI aldolase/citrate lyase family protein n=1 Tax=Undibacterium sp. TS12 TaxID=2908202 RepID=UPI001F4CC0DB|nr:aldolase/citrate lyase family protein [Undibacterium sp. TS12]MCH8621719.1 aldolase/citrate lyase family protein [Undibacterium sp. TS12]
MHPSTVLFQDQIQPVLLPVCDHYAGSEKLMRKSIALQQELDGIFDITLDCEDGAAAGNEVTHAQLVASLVASDSNVYQRLGVRVHDPLHPAFEQDLSLILPACKDRLAYLVLPKINSHRQLMAALEKVNQYGMRTDGSQVPVHVLIETHGALAEAGQIAALPQVECLSFGLMDFVSAHFGAIPASAMRSPGQFMHPLVMRAKLDIAAACHRFGKVASHNVTTEIRDLSVVADDARRAASECGYTRMWSIHPDQIRPIIQAFQPDSNEIEEATNILALARKHQWGPTTWQNHLNDRASYRYYWTILKRAQLGRIALPEAAQDLL